MPRPVVYLFPDTNLFIQGRKLHALDWSAWSDFGEVHLIVCAPVLREIDGQKKRGNDRVGRRAREASSLFREIATGAGFKVVRESGPCVKLSIDASYDYSSALADRLNYQERDDQIVGTVYQYAQDHPDADVRLLTHDTVPIFRAQALNIAVAVVPDDWLLPPEDTDDEKAIKALRAENARLKKAEPQIRMGCIDAEGEEVATLEYNVVRHEPLTEDQVTDLVQRLRARFPVETDFGPREAAERQSRIASFDLTIKETFTPATEEEISAYRDTAHPQWLSRCEETLRNCHERLRRCSGPPTFCFLARNEGTRPASDALVTITAKGGFAIKPPPWKDTDPDGDDKARQRPASIELPQPPSPPRGRWTREATQYTGGLGSFRNVDPTFGLLSPFSDFGRTLGMIEFEKPWAPEAIVPALTSGINQRRDPNAFFYKPDRPMTPQPSFSVECEQWRHNQDDEAFEGEIYFAPDCETVSGALEFRVQAENLSDDAVLIVPVRITITQVSVFSQAEELVSHLIGR